MNKRHFEKLAGVLRALQEIHGNSLPAPEVVDAVARFCNEENPRFDFGRFVRASQPEYRDMGLVSIEPAVKFFMEHATPGREQCARDLAVAEHNARQNGFSFEWSADADGCSMCDCCPKHGQAEAVVEQCLCRSQNGSIVASLCGICNASPEYRRLVEAELASEIGA